MASISRKFRIALKLNDTPAYRIAQKAGINPVALSRLINGIDRVKPDDERILKVASVLGLPESETFEETEGVGT